MPIEFTPNADQKKVVEAYNVIAEYFRQHCCFTEDDRSNLEGSGERASKALMSEMALPVERILGEVSGLLIRTFPVSGIPKEVVTGPPMGGLTETRPVKGPYAMGGLTIQSPIPAHGLCPHHFLPVLYKVTYAYLSGDGARVIGLSKLTRIAELLARRPVIQEQYCKDLVTVMQDQVIGGQVGLPVDHRKAIKVDGVMAVTSGVHLCMKCRGVENESDTTYDFFSGTFVGNPTLHARVWDVHARSGFYNGR